MDQQPVRHTTHPVLLIAAVAVILFCVLGLAAIMGWVPSSFGGGERYAPPPVATTADAPTQLPLSRAGTTPYDSSGASYAPGTSGSGYAPERAPARAPEPVRQDAPAVCHNCGVVEAVSAVKERAQGSGLGAGAGAVVGGLLGNQIGSGHGRQLATVAGAVGGAVVGNQVEGNVKATTSYTVRVRMEDGKYRTFHTGSASYREGDRLRLVNGAWRHR
jgi:outer membrane lipoprotein SlyB